MSNNELRAISLMGETKNMLRGKDYVEVAAVKNILLVVVNEAANLISNLPNDNQTKTDVSIFNAKVIDMLYYGKVVNLDNN